MPALRSPRFLHWMTRLALAAILLLAAMPSVSRWVASLAAVPQGMAMTIAVDDGGMAMDADAMSAMPGHHAHGHASGPDRQAPMPMGGGTHDGDVCAYCPLLASLLPGLLALAVLLPLLWRARAPAWTSAPRRHALPPLRGLGARGPPILL